MFESESQIVGRAVGALADVLGRPRADMDPDTGLTALGMESFTAVRFRRRLQQDVGLVVGLADLLGKATVRSVVAAAVRDGQMPDAGEESSAAPQVVDRDPDVDPERSFELTAIQQAYLVGRGESFPLGGVATFFYQEYDQQLASDGDVAPDPLGPHPDDPDAVVAHLERAWRTVLQRHPMLRLRIGDDNRGRPGPVREQAGFAMSDLRELSDEKLQQALQQITRERSHRLAPVDVGPLWDIAVSLLPGGKLRWHIGIDVLAVDLAGWFQVLQDWRDAAAGTPLPPQRCTFAEFVEARAASVEHSDRRNADEQYWQQRSLPAGGPTLPWQLDAPAVRGHRFARCRRTLDAHCFELLQRQAAARGLSVTGLLLAAAALVLDRWSAGGDFCLNTTLFDRADEVGDDLPGLGTVVGDFTSTILVEVPEPRLAEWDGFGSFAEALNRQFWTDLTHRAARPTAMRPRDDQPFDTVPYPVVFTSGIGLAGRDRPGGWLGEAGYGVSQTPQVLLDHIVWDEAGELVIAWDSVVGSLPEGRVEAMADAHRRLLELLTEDEAWQDRRLGWVPSFESDPPLVRHAAAGTVGPLLQDPALGAAALFPERPALLAAHESLTHAQLEARTAQVAQQLTSAGVRRGDLVGVSLDRGIDQIVAVHAVLAAGGAYVPIELSWPAGRVASIVQRSGLRTALVQDPHDPRFGESVTGQTLLQSAPARDDTADEAAVRPGALADDLAYAIFTSGSTGVPKGVAIQHAAVRTTIDDLWQRQAITADDRVLALSSYSFDLSVYDLFCVPAAGGAVVVPDADRHRDPGHWLELMEQHRVTIWNSAPALMEMLVEYADIDPDLTRRALGSLRLVMLSADWIPVTLPDRIRALAPQAELVSLGGATEASIWSIAQPIGEVPASWPSIPYGKPLGGQTFDILDAEGVPVRVGVPGQLHIGGRGLAAGYLGDPEQTDRAFFVHPHTGRRLYRTGDLGRWRTDGSIRFLGRVDRQVKIRGHRIELGEVEAVLDRHPAVRVSVARSVTGPDDRPRLVAYVVPAEGGDKSDGAVPRVAGRWAQEEDVIEMLRRSVPEFMVPSRFVVMDSLPLTANGKTDHAALPNPYGRQERPAGSAPGATRAALTEPTAAPAVAVPQRIVEPDPEPAVVTDHGSAAGPVADGTTSDALLAALRTGIGITLTFDASSGPLGSQLRAAAALVDAVGGRGLVVTPLTLSGATAAPSVVREPARSTPPVPAEPNPGPAALRPVLSAPTSAARNEATEGSRPEDDARVREQVLEVFRDLLGADVPPDDPFSRIGASSLTLVTAHRRLASSLCPGLRVVDVFEHPTVRRLSDHICRLRERPAHGAALSASVPGTVSATEPSDPRAARIAARRHARSGE